MGGSRGLGGFGCRFGREGVLLEIGVDVLRGTTNWPYMITQWPGNVHTNSYVPASRMAGMRRVSLWPDSRILVAAMIGVASPRKLGR
jgi:hypothetical protein